MVVANNSFSPESRATHNKKREIEGNLGEREKERERDCDSRMNKHC